MTEKTAEKPAVKRVKMSKSRGNVISPDEVVYGVYTLAPGYEFRDLEGQLVDWEKERVWFMSGRGYLTSTKYGRRPVFMHKVDDPIPVFLSNMETVQHVEEVEFWQDP